MFSSRKVKILDPQEKNLDTDVVKCENKIPSDCTRLSMEQIQEGKIHKNCFSGILKTFNTRETV